MKKRWYRSAGWKGALLLLAYAAAGLLAAAGIMLAYMVYLGVFPYQGDAPYEKCGAVTEDIFSDSCRILSDLQLIHDRGADGESASGDKAGTRIEIENQDSYEAEETEYWDSYALEEAKEDLATYTEGRTSLSYLYVDKSAKKVYTNNSSWEDYADYESNVTTIADGTYYFVIYPDKELCRTDLPGWESYDGEIQVNVSFETMQLHAEEYRLSEDYIFAVKLDTGYPVRDSYAEKSQNYNGVRDKSGYMVPVLAAALLVFFICVVWLTAAAGRRPEDGEIHLNFYDRIYTEIYLGITLISAALVYYMAAGFLQGADLSALNYGSSLTMVLALTAAIGAAAAAVSSVFYLSLVRRIKARSLYRNSLLKRCFALLKRIGKGLAGTARFYSRNTRQKLLYSGGMILLLILLAAGFLTVAGAWSLGQALFGMLLGGVPFAAAFVYVLREADGQDRILEGLKRISEGELTYKIPTEKLHEKAKRQAEYINNIGQGLDAAVAKSMKDERMKTELITNVSHDLKTPLTSIINYVDLLKRENFDDPKIQGYLKILDEKSQRLKVLTEDVVEASKASTGNLTLNMTELDLTELLRQVMAEVEERLQKRNLTTVVHFPEEPSVIRADGQRLWRVLENVFVNAAKYAMEGTRVYAEITKDGGQVLFTLKNISAQPLNISAEELTERFIRGDVSRNTEGSGLGLSIAKSLTELMGGSFTLYLDGDLFKVTVAFAKKKAQTE